MVLLSGSSGQPRELSRPWIIWGPKGSIIIALASGKETPLPVEESRNERKTRCGANTSNHNPWDEMVGHSQLCSKFEATLGYMKPSLKQGTKWEMKGSYIY